MLNYPTAERFFENCLVEAGLVEGERQGPSLEEAKSNPAVRRALVKALEDIKSGADVVLAKGKPAEDTLNLPPIEWERRWSAWAASRRAAFFARAALLMLGEKEYFDYFLNVLRTSHNIVFLGGASDVLQHATGYYLSGPQEDFTNAELAKWWEGKLK
jgi:hypothetical protein